MGVKAALAAVLLVSSASAQVKPVPPLGRPAAAPAFAALKARGWTEAGPWTLVLRRGENEHGRAVLAVDAVETAAPALGSAGHVDLKLQEPGRPAVLDGSLEHHLSPPAALPPGTSLADVKRGRMGFGLATASERRGRGLGTFLLELAEAFAVEAGAPSLVIYATRNSRPFYKRRFGGRVRGDEEFEGADESTYHRMTVELPPSALVR